MECLWLTMFSVRSGEVLCKLLTPDVITRIHLKRRQQSLPHEIGDVGGAKTYPTFKLAAATIVHMTREVCDDRLQIAIRFTGITKFAARGPMDWNCAHADWALAPACLSSRKKDRKIELLEMSTSGLRRYSVCQVITQ